VISIAYKTTGDGSRLREPSPVDTRWITDKKPENDVITTITVQKDCQAETGAYSAPPDMPV